MLKKIEINIDLLMGKYEQLDIFFRSAIEELFAEQNDISVSELIKDDGDNDLTLIDCLKDKVGVYLFIGVDNEIKYIGKGGTSRQNKKGTKGLRYRISQELCEYKKNPQNTLSKNIIDIDSILLNKTVTSNESIESIKKMKLRVFCAGERVKNDEVNISLIEKVESLEMILISLLPSKYNK
ncbi:hypothetical protein PE36_08001 [Moritella sp. PE36]|uniref:hypothetical protein n=1 Tax=Moritella sp. PE36 TaxID=58051 RepID=UPI0001568C84|nr:hypothetical protein [Moritella sp. PE36]EDM65928.1 hypothetical protein PE36_08001 [Moritella sp. PE36]